MTLTLVGHISALYRYPVKSMASETVQSAKLGWNGIEYDRRYAFVQSQLLNGFPWLTARQLPTLLRYKPRILGDNPAAPDVVVTTPQGRELALGSDALRNELEAASYLKLHLQCIKRGIFDAAPLSLISQASVAQLCEESKAPADARRYRPNIVLHSLDGFPFEEDDWTGRILFFGDGPMRAAMNVNQRDPRCMMINLDPDSAVPNHNVLKNVAQQHEGCAGVYGSVFAEGILRVGDSVYCGAIG